MILPAPAWRCIACSRLADRRLCDACVPTSYHRLAGTPGPAVLGPYDGPVGLAVRRVKVRRDTHLAAHLAVQAAVRAPHLVRGLRHTAIVPAPSLPTTRLTRGFSLASILAKALSTELDIPVRHPLVKSGFTKQSQLDRSERASAAMTSIRCRRRIHGRILLVDDVWTTGSTARACISHLKVAGACEVDVIALCAVSRRVSHSLSSGRIHPRRDQ